MKITCISPYVPTAASSHAGGLFLFHYVASLIGAHDVQLIAPSNPDNVLAVASAPRGLATYLFSVPRRPATQLGRAVRYLRWVNTGLNPGVGIVAAFGRDTKIAAILERSDRVEIHWSEYLSVVPVIRKLRPDIPLSAVLHDVWAQTVPRRALQSASLKERVGARLQLRNVVAQEIRLCNLCDLVFVFKNEDGHLLASLGVSTKVVVIGPYLHTPAEPLGWASGAREALFIGALHRPENNEGIRWFLRRVWPLVLRHMPQARLVVAGANPQPGLTSRPDLNLIVTGWVDDFDPLYRHASIFVAPLLTGGGLKFKVPQAMLYGLPVVATPIAAEGISPPAPPSVLAAVTDQPEAFANAVVSVMTDQARATLIGQVARQWVLGHFSFTGTLQSMEAHHTRMFEVPRIGPRKHEVGTEHGHGVRGPD